MSLCLPTLPTLAFVSMTSASPPVVESALLPGGLRRCNTSTAGWEGERDVHPEAAAALSSTPLPRACPFFRRVAKPNWLTGEVAVKT